MWTYAHFRLSYPEINTSEMVNFAGFQMLKMGNSQNAITLLEQNVKDYPDKSAALFELGRAYLSADRVEAARTQLETALELNPQNKDASRLLESLKK